MPPGVIASTRFPRKTASSRLCVTKIIEAFVADLGGQKSCNGLRPCREGGDALGLAPGAK
jgi:hypothetical protein